MAKLHQGNYSPKNVSKVEGNPTTITYRSGWELSVMLWCDSNPSVVKWGSEEIIIPYLSPLDGRYHRYYMDFKITFANGIVMLVELKPKRYTEHPKKPKNPNTKKYINEVVNYARNDAKWKAATAYAEKRGWQFKIWTEDTLSHLGIHVLSK